MPKKRFEEYQYIHFNRKITHKKMLRIIRNKAEQWGTTEPETIFKILEDAVLNLEKPQTSYAGLK
jgi:hypothetical protein